MPPDRQASLDVDLVARAKRGETEAFGDLYERHVEAIHRYVFYRVGEADEAENLTQTVFLKAWEALGRYEQRALPFSVWLYRIAHNTVVDYHRTNRKDTSLDKQYSLHSEADSPEEVADQRQQAERLARAIARLDEEDQQIIALRFVSGLSHAETAQLLGQKENYVRVLQHRALRALRALLKSEV